MTEKSLSDAIEEHVPYDGPHSHATVKEAVRGISALVRYLNNATGPGNDRKTLEWAATTYRLLGGLDEAFYGLDQLLDQLGTAMLQQADNPTLYDDRRGDVVGADSARKVAGHIEAARVALAEPRRHIEEAVQIAGHLGND